MVWAALPALDQRFGRLFAPHNSKILMALVTVRVSDAYALCKPRFTNRIRTGYKQVANKNRVAYAQAASSKRS